MTATLTARNASTPPLLRLPHELLDYIFELAYSEHNDDFDDELYVFRTEAQRKLVPAGTVCRALQPFVTKHLYGRIHFSSQTAFASLCTVLLATPRLANLVTDLRISLAKEVYRHYDTAYPNHEIPQSVEAVNGPMTAPAELVSAAAPLLLNFRSLTLHKCPSALGDALLLDSTSASFLRLHNLNLDDWNPRAGTKRGQIDLIARLATFPELFELRLGNPAHQYPVLPRTGECTLSCRNLASLRVDGLGFGREPPSYDIGALFPNLCLFDAYNFDENTPILPLIRSLPAQLQQLYVDRMMDDPEAEVIDIIPSLAHLTHLRTLILAHATFTPQSLLRYLRSSPQLRHLGFGRASGITDDVLAEIASLPQVKMLELDHVTGSKGMPLLEQATLEQLKHLTELWEPCDWDWQKPYFPPGVTLEGIKAAVVIARINGIVVEGTALDVPEDFDDAWQREVVSVVSEQYIKTGDLSMLEDLDVTFSEVLEYVRDLIALVPRPTSPLLRLPHELLDHIFELANTTPSRGSIYDEPFISAGPLCRTLQPFVRKQLYHRVHLDSQYALDLFCSTVAADPDLAASVAELTIDLSDEEHEYRAAASADENGPRPVPRFVGVLKVSATKLTAMSCNFVNLRHLALVQCPAPLGDAVLLDAPEDSLPHLEVLNVDAWEPRDGERKGRRDFNARLATFPTLRTLRLSARKTGLPIVAHVDEFTVPCKSLQTLDIDAWHPTTDNPPYNIGRLFPNLRAFIAHQLKESNPVLPIIETLPDQLDELYLWRYPHSLGLTPVDVIPLLSRFPRLRSLHLTQGTFTPPTLLRYLRNALHLRHLGFGRACDVSDATLLAIVSLPHLETLQLDHAFGHIGLRLLGLPHFRRIMSPNPLWNPLDWDWQEPQFPPGATLDGIEAAISLAQRNGIKVWGTAVGIPRDFDEAWRRERITVIAEDFIQTGDLSWLEPSGVTLAEVAQYLGGSLRLLREEHGVPSPHGGVASSPEQPL